MENPKDKRSTLPRWLTRLVSRFRQWVKHRRVMRACDESSKRMAQLTQSERRELIAQGLARVYPNGYWTCKAHGELISFRVANGKKCPMCNSANDQAHAPATKNL